MANDMPEGTPVEWAIIEDNGQLLGLFWGRCLTVARSSSAQIREFLNLAVRSCSSRCVKFLLGVGGDETQVKEMLNSFDEMGLSTFYYACVPDVFNHLLRSDSRGVPVHPRQMEATDHLMKRGCTTDVTQDKTFTVMHLMASYAEPELLRLRWTPSTCAPW